MVIEAPLLRVFKHKNWLQNNVTRQDIIWIPLVWYFSTIKWLANYMLQAGTVLICVERDVKPKAIKKPKCLGDNILYIVLTWGSLPRPASCVVCINSWLRALCLSSPVLMADIPSFQFWTDGSYKVALWYERSWIIVK